MCEQDATIVPVLVIHVDDIVNLISHNQVLHGALVSAILRGKQCELIS